MVPNHVQGPLARPGISTMFFGPWPYVSTCKVPESNEATFTGALPNGEAAAGANVASASRKASAIRSAWTETSIFEFSLAVLFGGFGVEDLFDRFIEEFAESEREREIR